jgi:CheY-like chemotaxis protein
MGGKLLKATRFGKHQYENTVASKSSPMLKTVLLVDDLDDCRLTTKWFLSTFGYAVDCVGSAEEALALFDPKIHDVVITDNSMPGMSGAEMAHVIKMRSPSTPVLMYSGKPPENRACLDLVVEKPVHLLALKEAVDQLLFPRTA